ncbi:DNA primase [candidate division CSSED10-310 bacterium]|uniref:DNA primase n=1 Tax=candidate division CSSED10-310 bacterium TaxID=2855610 RepID=A0ABV6YR03_UNCC1
MADRFSQFIPKEIIDQIRDRADLVQVLTPYVKLRAAGKNYLGSCPFHQEKKPSFTINPATQTYHCFGCNAGGNVFSFFMQFDNLTFPDAVRFVANLVGVSIPEKKLVHPVQAKKDQDEFDQLIHLNNLAAQFFVSILWEHDTGQAGRAYLEKRALDLVVAKKFQLGMAPPPWDKLYNYLLKKGIPQSFLKKSGLFIEKEASKNFYDRFRSRLMFPLYDVQGQIVGFAGRTLSGEDAKYINTPETPLYKKRKVLYGLHQGKEAIRREREILIVEGYFDLLTQFQHGIKNVVATCGTALTDDHINLLRRYSRNIKLVFDGDQAGINAAFRSLELMIERDFQLTVCPLSGSKDPDDFIMNRGIDEYKKALAEALKPFPFILNYAKKEKDFSQPDEVIAYLNEIMPFMLKITDPVKQSLIIKQAAEIAAIDAQDLAEHFRKRIKSKTAYTAKVPSKKAAFTDFEIVLLKLLLHYPRKIRTYHEELTHITLRNDQMNELLKILLSLWQKENIEHPSQWHQHWGLLPLKNTVTQFCAEDVIEKNIDHEIRGCITKAKEKFLEKKLKEKRLLLEQAQHNGTDENTLLQEIVHISSQLQALRNSSS